MGIGRAKIYRVVDNILADHWYNDMIRYRKKQALEDLAVKPVTQFPVEISNEDAFATFKNVRHVTIKKVLIDYTKLEPS